MTHNEKERIMLILNKHKCCLVQYANNLYTIKCHSNHQFDISFDECYNRRRRINICPKCNTNSGHIQLTEEYIQETVNACGYSFISFKNEVSILSDKHFKLKCPKNHIYETTWNNFKPKSNVPIKNCPDCANYIRGEHKRINIDEWQEKYKLTLLDVWDGHGGAIFKKYNWKCEADHEFCATINAIQDRQFYACLLCKRVENDKKKINVYN